jgi:hypothetical protein
MLAGLACVAMLLSGCGSAAEDKAQDKADTEATPASPAPTATKAPNAKPSPTPEGDGVLVPKGLKTGAPADALGSTGGRRLFGADYSWPQCPKGMGIPQKRTLGAPMPTDAARFVIIGLTNGPSFTRNPCLADQVAWAKQRKLLTAAYAVVSWPHQKTVDELGSKGPFGTSRLDQLRNVGHQAARYTIGQMRSAGLPSPIVWVDVEPVNDFAWSGTTQEQAAVVEGTVRGYTDAGLRVGIYSTPAMYEAIVGGLRFGVPEWRAAGQTSMAEALRRCGPDWSIQGGQGVFGQWVEDNRDRNVTCPGVDLRLGEYFHQF